MVSSKNLAILAGVYAVIVMIMAAAVHIVPNDTIAVSTVDTSYLATPVDVDTSFFDHELNSPKAQDFATSSAEAPVHIPIVTARAYLVGNLVTGKIYAEKNSKAIMPVASMSKLVTAFVATDLLDADEHISITEEALTAPPDSSGVKLNDVFSLDEILYPLLLNSSNVAAEALASVTDRKKFMDAMNSYAWEVGMPHGFFADPSGINPNNAASAQDLFGLAKYLYTYRKDILALTRNPVFSVPTTTEHGSYMFQSTHPFVRDSRFIGGKTGRTPEAGETMMTILNINSQPIAVIVLGSQYGAREGDTRLLLEKVQEEI